MHDDATACGIEVLNEKQRAPAAGPRILPSLANRAADVDGHWGGRRIGFRAPSNYQGMLTFRGLDVAIYRFASRAPHGQSDSLTPYTDPHVYQARVSRSEPSPTASGGRSPPRCTPTRCSCAATSSAGPTRIESRAINDAMYEQE
jgi:hypothetical protein